MLFRSAIDGMISSPVSNILSHLAPSFRQIISPVQPIKLGCGFLMTRNKNAVLYHAV